jgi:hypothetical protein
MLIYVLLVSFRKRFGVEAASLLQAALVDRAKVWHKSHFMTT